MFKNNKILAIIPARSGSKRLPKKNIQLLAGKPLIAWTIEAALKSKYIDKLIVSTDSLEIKEISEKFGAEIPFIRPKNLSTDTANSVDVIKHAIESYLKEFEYILLLQPTSPLRATDDIDNAIEILEKGNTKAVISVCQTEHSPLWCNTLPKNQSMENFIQPEIIGKRSQDIPSYYRINGAIYLSEIDYFFKNSGFIGASTKAYIMPQERSIDIDSEMDLNIAKVYLNNYL